ncbi:MAG: TIGR04283 family arsenosugar biosynthesis glycosyltransferase [Acetobacteraceae bacterium]
MHAPPPDDNATVAGLSVVIPTLNAARTLPATLRALGPVAECVVADGGSRDGTAGVAAAAGARVITAPRGRGPQIAAGIAAAQQDWLLILHADTRLQPGWRRAVRAHVAGDAAKAGYFRFALDSDAPQARRLERAVDWRCRVLALPYGDQGLLVHRRTLRQVGGVRPLPIMEDVDLIRRLGRRRLAGLEAAAVTSAEKWERDGWYARSARNLGCLLLWQCGVPPATIVRWYR